MNHEHFMKMAFSLAKKGIGGVSPNPLVGAVLVCDNKVIGSGYHQKYGEGHAEVKALADAASKGHSAFGATLYCNLEPCIHLNKQTPPCAPLIVKEKISQVVISNLDPNPEVSGLGIDYLRSCGVEVIVDILKAEGAILNEVFFTYIKKNRPFIHLKMAQSLDGRVATKNGESKYITGSEALKRVHALRQKYDGIMVGRKTVASDNPRLTVRSDEFENISNPLRLVLGKLENINREWAIFNDQWKTNTMMVTTFDDEQNSPEAVKFLNSLGVKLLTVKSRNDKGRDRVDLGAMFSSLANLKLSSILVEGGPTLATELLKLNLVDKVSFFIAPVVIGEGINGIGDLGIDHLVNKIELINKKIEILGNDILVEGYLCSPA